VTLALAVLAASLVGSPHCAGMCGPFVCFYAGGEPVRGGRRRAALHTAYHGGRLLSYVALGALAGALGAGLDSAGRLGGVSRLAAVAAGALMVGWGVARLAATYGVRLLPRDGPAAPRRWLARLLRAQRERPPVVRAAATGLLTTLLPCGWLYAFVVTAAGTGSVPGGAFVMLAFWAGTLPMLVAVGVGAQRLAGPLARRLPAASAALLVVLGLLTMGGRLRADVSLADMRDARAATAPRHVH
jgi:hypothetical protein